MSDNPSQPRVSVNFCLAVNHKDPDAICTRVDNHPTHCCDEVRQVSWQCTQTPRPWFKEHDHSDEKLAASRREMETASA